MASSLQALRDRLASIQVPAAGQGDRVFVPRAGVEEIVVHDLVQSALSSEALDLPPQRHQNIAAKIIDEFRSVFAILCQLGQERSVKKLIETRQITDKKLPVSREILKGHIPECYEPFYQIQWSYCAHSFSYLDYEQEIDDAMVLPYLEEEQMDEGGFGTVFKVKVHQDYFVRDGPITSQEVYLARKAIKKGAVAKSKIFQESETLYTLAEVKHANIVPIYGAYKQKGILNILFPWAESTLEQVFTGLFLPSFNGTEAFLKEMHGLADGVKNIHSFKCPDSAGSDIKLHGIHHDLKPSNILILDGKLVIADLGLCQMKPDYKQSQTKWKESTLDYGAPEARDPDTWLAKDVGRPFDVWSLGAILLELITYMLLGFEGVEKFRQQRVFDVGLGDIRCFHERGQLNQEVSKQFDVLKNSKPLTRMSQLLDLVRSMLAIDQSARPTSPTVVQRLQQIILGHAADEIISNLDENWPKLCESGGSVIKLEYIHMERTRLSAWIQVVCETSIESQASASREDPTFNYDKMLQVLESHLMDQRRLLSRDISKPATHQIHHYLLSMNDSLTQMQTEKGQTRIDDVFGILSATATGADRKSTIQNHVRHPSHFPRYEDVSLTASARHMAQILAGHIPEQLEHTVSPLSMELLERNQTSSRPQTYWYHLGTPGEEKVLTIVEWRDYGKKWDENKNDESRQIGTTLVHRVSTLVAMMQHQRAPDFRILECLGFVHAPKRGSFGLVLRFPNQKSVPKSLHTILTHKVDKRDHPSLTRKFSLALEISRSLHRLHLALWMHKRFCSRNILFFVSDQETSPKSMTTYDPYICGFEYSRPNRTGEYSEGSSEEPEDVPYQHPVYRLDPDKQFRHAYDYYSLGIVLLEIAMWKPLEQIFKKGISRSGEELKTKLIDFCNLYVAQNMGEIYHAVVLSCLNDALLCEETGSEKEERDQHLLFENQVLKELGACKA